MSNQALDNNKRIVKNILLFTSVCFYDGGVVLYESYHTECSGSKKLY